MNNMLGLVLVKIVHPAKKGIAYSSCNMKVTMITVKGATFLKNERMFIYRQKNFCKLAADEITN